MENAQNLNLKVSASPHVRRQVTTSDIMFDVILALVPATVFGIYTFGWYAGVLVAVCILTSVLAEFIYEKGMKKRVTVGDLSAVLTGLLIALNLPPKLPVWMAMIGCVFAIIVVKQLFGGLGQNFMNPALGARCFLLLSFSKYMTQFVYDGVTTATPLSVLKSGGDVKVMDMFVGHTAGTIGETSTIALLIGAGYLLIKRVISPKIPVLYIGTFAACIAIYAAAKDMSVVDFTLAHLCGGGLMLGAWFMATDYVTSPITSKGKVVYGIILGLLTFVLRIYGASAEGVSYAIIISNLLVPLIEKATAPKAFGYKADMPVKPKKSKDSTETENKEKTEKTEKAEKSEKSIGFNTKGIVKAVAAIFIITLFMGAALGLVYNITKDPIADANDKAKQEAYKEVMPDATDIDEISEGEEEENKDKFYKVLNQNLENKGFEDVNIEEVSMGSTDTEICGFVIIVSDNSGYGGEIKMAVGINMSGSITGISFLKISETAGLGMEAKNEDFLEQYIGKNVSEFTVTKTGSTNDSEIDALSGATITSKAVTEGVNAAIETFVFMLSGGEN